MQAFERKSFNELFDLTGKTAIVTGGANGIGKATALRLAQAGANIVIADLKLEDANKAAKEIESYGVKALAVECNILKDEDLVAMVDKTVEIFGCINILISNRCLNITFSSPNTFACGYSHPWKAIRKFADADSPSNIGIFLR